MAAKIQQQGRHSARRNATAGYARGEETRVRIIRAAVELFGNHGFDRVSTRDIAARAEVNAPVLQYYFDGKEGLYVACVEHMLSHTARLLQPVITTVRARMQSDLTPPELIDCVCYIYEQAAEFLLTQSEMHAWKRFAAWEVVDRDTVPVSARKLLDGGIGRELRRLLFELVGRITGRTPEDELTRLRVVTLGGQLAIFHHARQKVLADIGWTAVSARELALLKSVAREQTTAVLRAAAAKS